jgi:hypothetical protein
MTQAAPVSMAVTRPPAHRRASRAVPVGAPRCRTAFAIGTPGKMRNCRWVRDCDELLAAEPAEVRQVIREHEADGFTARPEYQAAILGFYRKHVCRLRPRPAGLERSFAEAGYEVLLRRVHAGPPHRDGPPHRRLPARDHRGRLAPVLRRAAR